VAILYTLYAVSTNVVSAGVSFQVPASTLKMEIDIAQWPFAMPTNRLLYKISLNIQPAVLSVIQTNSSEFVIFTFNSVNQSTTIVRLLRFGVVDGSGTGEVEISLLPTNDSSTFDVRMLFPQFASTFHYDPDFSVTLSTSNGSGGGGGGDGNSQLLPLIALAALIIPIMFILLAIGLLAVLVYKKRARRSSLSKGLAQEYV
jgi:hypothetical protein